jgi:hypothetical protein
VPELCSSDVDDFLPHRDQSNTDIARKGIGESRAYDNNSHVDIQLAGVMEGATFFAFKQTADVHSACKLTCGA